MRSIHGLISVYSVDRISSWSLAVVHWSMTASVAFSSWKKMTGKPLSTAQSGHLESLNDWFLKSDYFHFLATDNVLVEETPRKPISTLSYSWFWLFETFFLVLSMQFHSSRMNFFAYCVHHDSIAWLAAALAQDTCDLKIPGDCCQFKVLIDSY